MMSIAEDICTVAEMISKALQHACSMTQLFLVIGNLQSRCLGSMDVRGSLSHDYSVA